MRAGTRYYTMFYSRWQLIIMKSTPLSLYHQITFQQHYFRDLVEIPSFTCPKLQTHDTHSVQHELRSMSHNFNRLFDQIPLQKLPSAIVAFKQLPSNISVQRLPFLSSSTVQFYIPTRQVNYIYCRTWKFLQLTQRKRLINSSLLLSAMRQFSGTFHSFPPYLPQFNSTHGTSHSY